MVMSRRLWHATFEYRRTGKCWHCKGYGYSMIDNEILFCPDCGGSGKESFRSDVVCKGCGYRVRKSGEYTRQSDDYPWMSEVISVRSCPQCNKVNSFSDEGYTLDLPKEQHDD